MQDILEKILLPLRDRSAEYLNKDLEIPAKAQEIKKEKFIKPCSIKNASLLATSGSIEIYASIGFDDKLFDELVNIFLQGDVLEGDELIEIRESISCEIVNIIVGNAIINPMNDSKISITPPLYIDDMSLFFKDKSTTIMTTIIQTEYGNMYIAIVYPVNNNIERKENA